MFRERDKWVNMRFGEVDESIFGRVEDVKEIVWPDIVREYQVKENLLTYKMLSDIENSAERVAQIYENGYYELINNRKLEWHIHPEKIIEKVQTGDWNFYGCFLGDDLIAAESMRIHRGDRTMMWKTGCVDPAFRGKGVWRHIGIYNDLIVEKSGAQMGAVWVITTHKYSQMCAERAGYIPMGYAIGYGFSGGGDNLYYRRNRILYGKLYGDAWRHRQNRESEHLTEKARKLADVVESFWNEKK